MIITTNGFETVDGCLFRNDVDTGLFDVVISHARNRHLPLLPIIPPAGVTVYVPENEQAVREQRVVQLWD